mmetsp:Transcript_21838/g.55995  ORF Transcript_21838/g.55995 Transcript_21838/m.55995 type:complete len:100 (+) Transcript_21838:115-414(+)
MGGVSLQPGTHPLPFWIPAHWPKLFITLRHGVYDDGADIPTPSMQPFTNVVEHSSLHLGLLQVRWNGDAGGNGGGTGGGGDNGGGAGGEGGGGGAHATL